MDVVYTPWRPQWCRLAATPRRQLSATDNQNGMARCFLPSLSKEQLKGEFVKRERFNGRRCAQRLVAVSASVSAESREGGESRLLLYLVTQSP